MLQQDFAKMPRGDRVLEIINGMGWTYTPQLYFSIKALLDEIEGRLSLMFKR